MTRQFKRILAAMDRSVLASDIFEQALALAQQNHSHLMLTHCISLKTLEQLGTFMDAGFGLASPAKLRQLQEQHLEEVNEVWQWLCAYAIQAQAQGVVAEVTCETGDAGTQICSLAQQWDADLIVIGHGGKPSLKEKLFGSTTNHVVLHAPCTVMAVQPRESAERLMESNASEECANRFYTDSNYRLNHSIWNQSDRYCPYTLVSKRLVAY